MKKIKISAFCLLLLGVIVSCSGKRPDNGTLEFNLTVKAIQKNAEVQVLSGETVIASDKTDKTGGCRFDSLRNIGDLLVKVCGGTVDLVSSEEEVAWNGCMEKKIKTGEGGEIEAVVDFVSTFIGKYSSETSAEEWFSYLGISGDAVPELQSSLTDSTKRRLWIQGLAKIAETVSKANEAVPETQFSTENLLNFLFDDLTDDNVINGSTGAKFGTLPVNAAVLKGFAADAVTLVSDRFSETELKEWSDKIRNSEAAFLGGGSSGKNDVEITITVYPEGQEGAAPEYFSGNVVVEAAAVPENAVISLICFANGVKMNDLDEEIPFFKGVFSTLETEGEEILIRCEASNGIDVKSTEKSILVNNDAPLVEANFFETGTNIVTGTKENPAKNRIDLKVQASHEKYAIEELSCSVENYQMTNTASGNWQYSAVIDTTELPEGKNVLHCVVTVNRNRFAAGFDFYVKNTVVVSVKPFIAHALSKVKSVDADCGNGFKGHYTGLDGISLKRGQICTVVVSGGVFRSVTLSADNNDLRSFGGTLSAVVIPESEADVVVTPVTTIDEIVYSSRVAAEADKTETFAKSKESILRHFSNSFKLSGEPKNTKSMDEGTKYFILLAGLENLAYFLEMQIGAEHGAYSIGNILDLLRDDYSDLTFDGRKNNSKLVFGTEKTFGLDSNFFRYYYATAVKRFLQSGFNKTNITNIGSILNQISMNSDQFLFPAESETVAIESDGPAIEISTFRNLSEYIPAEERVPDDVAGELGFYLPLGETSEYKTAKYPYFAKAFVLNFALKPENGNFIDLNSLKFSENDSAKFEYTRLSPAEIEGDGFTNHVTEFSYLIEYDDSERAAAEKQIDFMVSAADVAFNESFSAVKTFLDSKPPVFTFFLPENMITNGNDGFKIEFEVADNAVTEVEYCIDKFSSGTDTETGAEIVVKTTVKCASDTFSDPKTSYVSEIGAHAIAEFVEEAADNGSIAGTDGKYEFRITATDKAGNRRTEIKEFEIDTVPPANFNVRSYNTKNNLYVFSSWDNLPHWLYLTMATSTKVDLYADEDADTWDVKLICCPKTSESSGFFSDCSGSGEESFEKHGLRPDETAVFEGLPDSAECRGTVRVCDKVRNCTSWKDLNYGSEVLASYMSDTAQYHKLPEIWFVIDTVAPTISNIDVVAQECVQSSYHILPQCTTVPKCVSGGVNMMNTEYPRILAKYENDEAVSVTIRSLEGAWADRECVKKCSDQFYCDLRGSVNGYNNFKLTACDLVGNCKEDNIAENMDMSVVEPINLKLSRSFFTEQKNTKVSWTTKSGVSYACKISKDGDTSYSQNCANGQVVNAENLNGTGFYTITVDSSSSSTARSDQISFVYFRTSDLSTTFTPVTGQILNKNENFKFESRISSADNLAKITKIEYFLYGLYKNGQNINTNEYPVASMVYPMPVNGFSNTVSAKLSLDVYGQFRNLRAKITFSDDSVITRNATGSQADSFLYCLLGDDEKMDDVKMTFSNNNLIVSYKKPDCLSENEYKLSISTKKPSQCSGYQSGGMPGQEETEPFEIAGGSDSYSIKATHTIMSRHKHCDGEGTCVVGAGCYGTIHTFPKATKAVLKYNFGKTYEIPSASFDWNKAPVQWEHYRSTDSCGKCSALPKTVSCAAASGSEILILK